MSVPELIDRLADDLAPPRLGPRRLVASVPIGFLLFSVAAMIALFGAPLAALPAIGTAPFAMKLGFAASLALAGGVAVYLAGIPGRSARLAALCLAAIFSTATALAVAELASFGPAWMGSSWRTCLASVSGFGLLGLAGAMAVLRRLAPTRPALAGAYAGLTGGALAATSYALWCPETHAQFLLLWYGGPILALAALGAALGPRLLRW